MMKFFTTAAAVLALGLVGSAFAGPECHSGDKAASDKEAKSGCSMTAKASCGSDAGMVKGGGDEAGKADCASACATACKDAGMVKGGGDEAGKEACAKACATACKDAGMVKGGGDEAGKAACASACSAHGMTKGGGDEAGKAACASACATACASHGMTKGGGDETAAAEGYGLGQKVPDFTLADTKGQKHNLSDFAGKPVVLVFYNQDCPFVVEMWDRLSAFTNDYKEKGVQVLAIDSGNNVADDVRAKHASDKPYPVLVNTTSEMALNFNAKRTPEVFILDQQGVVQYHGAFDNGQAGSEGERKTFAKDAVDALLAGKTPEVRETKAFGCSIKFNRETLAKWKAETKGEKTKS